MPAIKCIATDVDGTLLNSQHQISPRTLAAVRRATALGVPVILATGRPRTPRALSFVEALHLRAPAVFLHGTLICDAQGHALRQRTLAAGVTQQAVEMALRHDCGLVAYGGVTAYTGRSNPFLEYWAQLDGSELVVMPSLQALPAMPVNKVVLFAEGERIGPIRAELAQALGERATLTRALPGTVEVLPPGASKGEALAWLLPHLGLAPAELLAIGDAENDCSMIELAGVGVAMASGEPGAQAVADYITAGNDQDGVALAIERFVLGA